MTRRRPPLGRRPAHSRALAVLSVLTGGLALTTTSGTATAATVSLTQPPDVLLGSLTPTANAATDGMFSAVQNWPVIPVNVSLLPTGKVVSYGSPPGQAAQNAAQVDNWDPSLGFGSGAHSLSASFSVNSFCNIAKIGADGKLLFVGGNNQFSASTYDASSQVLTSTQNAMKFPRWYASMVRLPDDRMVVVGGAQPYSTETYVNGDNTPTSPTPEIFTPGVGWTALTGATSTDLFGGANDRWWYPKTYVAPDGNVFGISFERMWKLNPTGAGTITQVGTVPGTGVGASAASVMYAPGQILLAGGGQRSNTENAPGSAATSVIDITGATPKVASVTRMARARNWGTMTVLPNGEVFMSGGTSNAVDGATAVYQSEIWNPTTKNWRTAATATKIRTYHSTSMLLPSGAVLTGGGGIPGPQDNFNVEMYFPPSLFTRTANGGSAWANRNEIRTLAGDIAYGQQIILGMKDNRAMSSMSLISVGSVTHSYNSDQRRIPLTFTQAASSVTAAIPADHNMVPPGFYELQGVDTTGVPTPSQIVEIRNDGLPGKVTVYGTGAVTPPPTTPTVPLTTGTKISLEATNFPGFRIRHAYFTAFISAIAAGSDPLSRNDATFTVRAGLANTTCTSFESVNYPGYFLRHQNYKLVLQKQDTSSLFANDATFCARPGLPGSGTSFESVNFPGYYLRHQNYQVYLQKPDGTDLFKWDSAFTVTNGLA